MVSLHPLAQALANSQLRTLEALASGLRVWKGHSHQSSEGSGSRKSCD